MQRFQRIRHRLTWLFLTPLLIAVLYFALRLRPPEALNEQLPSPPAAATAPAQP